MSGCKCAYFCLLPLSGKNHIQNTNIFLRLIFVSACTRVFILHPFLLFKVFLFSQLLFLLQFIVRRVLSINLSPLSFPHSSSLYIFFAFSLPLLLPNSCFPGILSYFAATFICLFLTCSFLFSLFPKLLRLTFLTLSTTRVILVLIFSLDPFLSPSDQRFSYCSVCTLNNFSHFSNYSFIKFYFSFSAVVISSLIAHLSLLFPFCNPLFFLPSILLKTT